MVTTVYKGKLVSCYYLRERKEYEPCNNGKSEHLAGIGWDCEYAGDEVFEMCKDCPVNNR